MKKGLSSIRQSFFVLEEFLRFFHSQGKNFDFIFGCGLVGFFQIDKVIHLSKTSLVVIQPFLATVAYESECNRECTSWSLSLLVQCKWKHRLVTTLSVL